MAVKLAGVRPGDNVFCSDMTFDATVNPVVYEGGVPVFIDTEYDTWNMDPVALEKAFELYPDVKPAVTAPLCGAPGKWLETVMLGSNSAISYNGNNVSMKKERQLSRRAA
jgi:dTDP-4-amino-4,6-dideoxygalactose transaminase